MRVTEAIEDMKQCYVEIAYTLKQLGKKEIHVYYFAGLFVAVEGRLHD